MQPFLIATARPDHTLAEDALVTHCLANCPKPWLPGPPQIRTFAASLNVILYLKPDFAKNGRPERCGYRYAFAIEALPPTSELPRVREETPLERGRRFQAMLDSGQVKSRAELAKWTKARLLKGVGDEGPSNSPLDSSRDFS